MHKMTGTTGTRGNIEVKDSLSADSAIDAETVNVFSLSFCVLWYVAPLQDLLLVANIGIIL